MEGPNMDILHSEMIESLTVSPFDMKTCGTSLRAIGTVLGAWGFVGSLFFTIAFTFRQDAWQVFGGTMIVIIILLALSTLACLVWLYGAIYTKHWFMLGALIYWIIPLIYCIRFIWMPIRHNRLNRGEYLHYFNVEEDNLTVRFEMTMTRPEHLPIYSSLFVLFYFFALVCYAFTVATSRRIVVDDPRFNVQDIYKTPPPKPQRSAQETHIY